MAVISWGKPEIYIGAAGAVPAASSPVASFYKLSTPVEDSTNLTGEDGEKIEAKIEGGGNEATKYKDATFELTMKVRMALDTVGNSESLRRLPIPLYKTSGANETEYTADNVAVVLIPENNKAPGFFCPDCSVSIKETFTTADGAIWEITLNPNTPASGKAVQWNQYYAGTISSNKYPINIGVKSGS